MLENIPGQSSLTGKTSHAASFNPLLEMEGTWHDKSLSPGKKNISQRSNEEAKGNSGGAENLWKDLKIAVHQPSPSNLTWLEQFFHEERAKNIRIQMYKRRHI